MKLLFIYPIIGTGETPLNLSYLTAIAKRESAEVRVFDTSCYPQYANRIDEGQASAGQFIQTPISLPLRGTDPKEDLLRLVNNFKPDLVCATAFTNTYALGLYLLRHIKRFDSVPTLFGGVHTTLVPESVIAESAVDMICVGEGEGVIEDICRGVHISEIKNLWYKKSGVVFKNPMRPLIDLDTLPYQDFDEYEDYNFYRPLAGKIYHSISTDVSRGCPYKCSYCVNHAFQKLYAGLGPYHRIKVPYRAIENLIHLKKRYRPELIRFWDEDFTTLPLNWLIEFSRQYIKYIHLPFLIYARADTMSEEKAALLKAMGCITVAMGIESGCYSIRKAVLNRNMSDERIVEAFKVVRRAGIRVTAYNMIGLPHENRRDIFQTIDLNRRCKPDSSSVAFLEPYQNTEIFEDCVKGGYVEPGYIATFDFLKPHINEVLITHKELKGIIKTFILYTKAPKILWPLVKLCERGHEWIYKILLKIFHGR